MSDSTDRTNPESGGKPERVEHGIAAYLEQFDRSPYHLPPSDYISLGPNVVSTEKGSWVNPKTG
jgi:hypothetical protein